MRLPNNEEIETILNEKEKAVEDYLSGNQQEVEQFTKELDRLTEELQISKELNWQDQKELEKLLEEKQKIEEGIQELQKKNEEFNHLNKTFSHQTKEMQQKKEEFQKLLHELLNEDTKKLYEQLQELMKENVQNDQIQQQLDKIQKSEHRMMREMERAIELFKRLQLESMLQKALKNLEENAEKQEALSEKETLSEKNIDEQNEIKKNFEDFRKSLDEVQKLNQQLKRPEPMKDFELEERQIQKELEHIEKQLQEEINDPESADKGAEGNKEESKSDKENKQKQQSNPVAGQQKSASKKMKTLKDKFSKMQGGMQMEMMQVNLDQLRDILDNLIKLSFNQEDLMIEARNVDQSDPRFLEISQKQLNLQDNAKVLKDSLLSLADRVVQISSFVTREVGLINENVDKSIEFFRERNRTKAISSQQFAMTSMNNLALLLDNTMEQIQMSMSQARAGQPQQQQLSLPDLQELQKQLGKQMEKLHKSGKSGRELSEELARMAAQQELIRRQLQEIQKMNEGQMQSGGQKVENELRQAIQQMEQNEIDLVYKRLNQRLINRQKRIETRMLEVERSQRNQGENEERESERPSVILPEIPPEFEEYIKSRQKEKELLKTIPLEFNEFYKHEVNQYFRRISIEQQDD